MFDKTVMVPERRRQLAPPFAWVDRRFLFDGFLQGSSQKENLLYFFLVLAADRDGLSFYGYDRICQLLKLTVDDYVEARDGLLEKHLIACDGRQFQVLALPRAENVPHLRPKESSEPPHQGRDSKSGTALAEIFTQMALQKQKPQR
jgi:hypothetical protein